MRVQAPGWKRLRRSQIGALWFALLSGCTLPENGPEAAGAGVQAVQPPSSLVVPSGFPLNGTRASGALVRSVDLRGGSLHGAPLDSVRLEGSMLVATLGDRILRGRALLGAVLTATLLGGDTVTLRLYDTTSDAAWPDLHYYRVAHLGPEGWRPICEGANEAIALSSVWDYREGVPGGGSVAPGGDRFTLACRGAALAQCVELGYAPWRAPPPCPPGFPCPATLADHHQACVRLHRADYCGDGRSWTRSGIYVNVFDALGIQKDTEAWTPEAEWSADGATCIRSTRLELSDLPIPACAQQRPHLQGRCFDPDHFRQGTLLMNERNRRGQE